MYADTTVTSPETGQCPNKFPNMITDVCWSSLFPIKLGGFKILDFGSTGDNSCNTPGDSCPNSVICTCPGPLGVPRIGVPLSYWEPVKVVETVRRPYCFPFLFGLDMNIGWYGAAGEKSTSHESGHKSFVNVHMYSFPLFYVLQLIGVLNGCIDNSEYIDLLGNTEIDPLWNNDQLEFMTSPESAVFANPVAQGLCSVDCVGASSGWAMNDLFWCGGCWGSLYPYTGNIGTGSPVVNSLLASTRFIAAAARNGWPYPETVTSGTGAMCSPYLSFMIKKSQYKISMLSPIAMTQGTCSFPIGRSTIISTAEYRTIPATGEDYIWQV